MKTIKIDEVIEIEKLSNADALSSWLTEILVRDVSGYLLKVQAPRVECKDGTTLSVQASESHYCSPRENNPGFYRKVEFGRAARNMEGIF